MKLTDHHKKVIVGALVFGVVLFLLLYFWNRYRLQQAASATVNNSVDAQMNAQTAPGYLYAEYLPTGVGTNYTVSDPTVQTAPNNTQVQAYNAATSSTIPVTAWEYNPNFQLYYQVPQIPNGTDVPQVTSPNMNHYVSGIEPA